MVYETTIPKSHKDIIILATIGHRSLLGSTVVEHILKYTDQLKWEAVTSDLVQEWKIINLERNNYYRLLKHNKESSSNQSQKENPRKELYAK